MLDLDFQENISIYGFLKQCP